MTILKKRSLYFVFIILTLANVSAEDYPFDLPSHLKATIHINSSNKEVYNNLQLGTNIHHFSSSTEKSLIQKFDPITVRFPHGLWSNWYDWRRDVSRLYGEEKFVYKQGVNGTEKTVEVDMLANIKIFDNNNIKVGIDGLTSLNAAKSNQTGRGYDMMWTFNMSEDGPDLANDCSESVARYKDLIERGFEVKVIEMGNECFYPGQRSSYIPNSEDYIARAKAMSAALKAQDSAIRVSIPLLRKNSWANPNWNEDLTVDQSYFDAVTIHTYVGSDPDNANDSDEAYGTALTARKHLMASITDFPHKMAPTKPIWLTEWGVKSGGPNAVSALGMVDCYLMMSENQDIFERANWFSVNGKLNSHVVWETYISGSGAVRPRIKYPLQKTLFGSAYEIIRSVLENSTLMESEVAVADLTNGVKAVNAQVVSKDGKTTVFVVNLSNQDVSFTVNIDGTTYDGAFLHKAMSFSKMDEERALGIDVDPLSVVKEGSGKITLPKFSINTIQISDMKPGLDFMHLGNNDIIEKGINLSVEATVGIDFKEVALFVNDTDLGTQTEAPFVWADHALLTNMMDAQYVLKLVGKNAEDETTERSIIIKTPSQWAHTSNLLPHPVPGIIQFEAYDHGEANDAYYDRSDANASKYAYRDGDNVDLSSDSSKVVFIQGKEWLEYTVNVAETGYYALEVNHETRRSPEFPAITISFTDEGVTLFSDFVATHTGSGVYKTDTVGNVLLHKGKHILRFYMVGYGFDLDYFEWKSIQNAYKISFNDGDVTSVHYSNIDSTCTLPTPPELADYAFDGWETEDGTAFDAKTVVSTDVEVFAKWKIKQFNVSLTSENGTVSSDPQKELHDINSTVTLTATPNDGYLFMSWSGDHTGTENPLVLEVKDEVSLMANFAPIATGAETPLATLVQVSPNPNNGTFTIILDNQDKAQYKIYSLAGAEVQSGYFVSETIVHLNTKERGAFILEVRSKESRSTQKIVVKL